MKAQEATDVAADSAPMPMPMPNMKVQALQQLFGKLQMMISDCLKQLTGMDLNVSLHNSVSRFNYFII